MEASELQAMLKAGIAAVRQGDRARGRELLQRVVEADERVEPAWLWLSAAVDDPADQLLALENVLALNPRHAQAITGAQALRAKLGILPEPPGEAPLNASPEEPMPASAPPPVEAFEDAGLTPDTHTYRAHIPEDDPYQCAYCGRQTMPEDTRCPHCRRGLLVPGLWRGGGHLYIILILAGLQTQLALLQAAGVYGYQNFPKFAGMLPGGDIWAANLVVPAVARAVLWALIVLVLLAESHHSFRVALAVSAADLAWTGAGYALGYVGQVLASINAVFSGFILLLALAAVIGEFQSRVRVRVVLDKNLQSADQFERSAEVYARQGKWALAALHWRRAIALRPREPAYYKSLGHAQMRLGRTTEALQAWASGAEVDPADKEFHNLTEQSNKV